MSGGPEPEGRRSPSNDHLRVQEIGLGKDVVKRVTLSSSDGTVIFERHKKGSLTLKISSDSGISEGVIPGGVDTLGNVYRRLRPKRAARAR